MIAVIDEYCRGWEKPEGEEAVEKMEMKEKRIDFDDYILLNGFFTIFTVFAVVSICFNLVTYMRKTVLFPHYRAGTTGENQLFIQKHQWRTHESEEDYRQYGCERRNRSGSVLPLWLCNSYENKLMEAIRKRCMEIDNLNSFVSSSYFIFGGKS